MATLSGMSFTTQVLLFVFFTLNVFKKKSGFSGSVVCRLKFAVSSLHSAVVKYYGTISCLSIGTQGVFGLLTGRLSCIVAQ